MSYFLSFIWDTMRKAMFLKAAANMVCGGLLFII